MLTRSFQDERRRFQSTAKKLADDERKFVEKIVATADLEELNELLESFLRSAQAKQQTRMENQGILRQSGGKAVAFANSFSKYLQAYSGIVEVVKSADQQYGGIAYGALSVLLIVGVNKKRKETCIEQTLLILQRQFLMFPELQEVHSTSLMHDRIKDVVIRGIAFSLYAIEYYSRSSWHRIRTAVISPPNMEIEDMVSAITEAIAEVMQTRDHLDSMRLQKVDARVQRVEEGVATIRSQVGDVQSRSVADDLYDFRSRLGLTEPNTNKALEDYAEVLDNAFSNLSRWEPLSFSDIEGEERYRQWTLNPKSSLLLLYGKSRAHDGDCCWLSAANIGLITAARRHFGANAVYLCQPHASTEEDVPLELILRDLAFQFIKQGSSKLSQPSVYKQVFESVEAVATATRDPEKACSLLAQTVELFDSVFILIDRSDRIAGNARDWLEHLARLLKSSKAKIHVVLIASANGNDEPGGKVGKCVIEAWEGFLDQNFYHLQMDGE